MAAPKLRFKEFDGSWKEVTLKNCITSIDSGWSPQCESYPANSNEWGVLKTTSVDWSGFNSCFNKKLPLELTPRKEIEVKPLDILVTRAGPTERVGVISVVPHSVRSKLMISDKLIRLKANEQNNPLFLGISLSSVKCQNQLQSKTSGLAKSQTNISQKILGEVLLKLPSKEEQTKIASFLSVVDEKISQLKQKHELLSQYKQGMMQKLFSQQIRFKADDGREFGEWTYCKLNDIAQIYDGTHQTPNYVEKGVPFYSVEHVTANDFSDTKFIAEDVYEAELKRVRLEKGDILMTRIGDIGTSRLIDWDVKASFYVSLALIKIKKGHSSSFIDQYIKSENFQRELHERTIHVAFPKKINLGEIGLCKVELPTLEEQTKIANFLSAIDQKIEKVAQQIKETKQWKKGLLQQMFV